MNVNDAKEIAATLRFIETMTENTANSVYCEDGVSDDLVKNVEENSEHLHGALRSVMKALWETVPAFADGLRLADAEAMERGRAWSEQRSEQLRLLRLSGDDTPEEDVPFGPFGKKGGAA